MEKEILKFDTMGIQKCQRNRYPLLFIDKVEEAVPMERAHAIKNFSYNEWFFRLILMMNQMFRDLFR